MRKIGINFEAIGGMEDERYVATMVELGFEAVFTEDQPSDRRQIECAELFSKHGLSYEFIHAPFCGINSIWHEGDEGEAMYDSLVTCIDRCALVGVPIAVVHLSSGMTPPPTTDLGRARFDALIDHAAKKNVRIAFENQRKLYNLSWALETYGDAVGFCWDCGHESCFTPGKQFMPLFGNRLICLHLHDNEGIFNQDSHLLPFDGAMDFDRIARQIRESGYSGALMLEAFESHSTRYVEFSPEEYLQRASAAAKRLRTMVDGE